MPAPPMRQPEPEQPAFRVPEAVQAPEPVQMAPHHPIDEELLAFERHDHHSRCQAYKLAHDRALRF